MYFSRLILIAQWPMGPYNGMNECGALAGLAPPSFHFFHCTMTLYPTQL